MGVVGHLLPEGGQLEVHEHDSRGKYSDGEEAAVHRDGRNVAIAASRAGAGTGERAGEGPRAAAVRCRQRAPDSRGRHDSEVDAVDQGPALGCREGPAHGQAVREEHLGHGGEGSRQQ